MFVAAAFVLIVAWVLGYSVFHIAGSLIHILLLLAIIAFVWHVIQRQRVTRSS